MAERMPKLRIEGRKELKRQPPAHRGLRPGGRSEVAPVKYAPVKFAALLINMPQLNKKTERFNPSEIRYAVTVVNCTGQAG